MKLSCISFPAVLIPVLLAFSACSPSLSVRIDGGESAAFAHSGFTLSLSPSAENLAQTLAGGQSLFDAGTIADGFARAGFPQPEDIRADGNGLRLSVSFGKIPLESHAVFQTGTGGARAFDLRPAEKTLNIRLTRGNVRQIADLLPAELFAYSDLFMAPVLTGEQLSENEYTALIGAAYGPRAEQEMREAVFTLTAECPAAVAEATALIQTGAGFQDAPDIQVETNGGQVCFRIPVARLLCLTQPVSLSVRWQ